MAASRWLPGRKIHKHTQAQPSASFQAVLLMRPGRSLSALGLCGLRPGQGAAQLCSERAFSKGLVGVRQRGGVELFLMVVRLIFPNLTLAKVYWPILNSCSDSVLMKF